LMLERRTNAEETFRFEVCCARVVTRESAELSARAEIMTTWEE
jgi:hypothetical protein